VESKSDVVFFSFGGGECVSWLISSTVSYFRIFQIEKEKNSDKEHADNRFRNIFK
jgi:hypothetical protein